MVERRAFHGGGQSLIDSCEIDRRKAVNPNSAPATSDTSIIKQLFSPIQKNPSLDASPSASGF
jgi:hypothetical protein